MSNKNNIQPKFVRTQKVISSLSDKPFLEVEDWFWNGLTWMYSFKDEEMSCGQEYLKPYYQIGD